MIRQNPTPQLNVCIISRSEIFLLFSHLNILVTLIFERSIFRVKLSGIDLNRFSTKPPPVMCAEAFIRLFFVNFKTSLE